MHKKGAVVGEAEENCGLSDKETKVHFECLNVRTLKVECYIYKSMKSHTSTYMYTIYKYLISLHIYRQTRGQWWGRQRKTVV